MDIIQEEKDLDNYFYVTYYLESSVSVLDAATALAIGQTFGNPNARSAWETTEMIEKFCAKIIRNDNFDEKSGEVEIGFPLHNIDWKTDGVAQLLCTIAGGQSDINTILKCRALRLDFSTKFIQENFNFPKYGLSGLRDKSQRFDRPLFGGIIKPKTGLTKEQLLDMTKKLVEGGVDFIKEDEIMANPAICPLEERVEFISNYISNTNVTYCFCINSDPSYIIPRAKFVQDNGGNGIHINVWSGLGSYKNIRDNDFNLFLHFQKSGDKFFTDPRNPFSVSWFLICQLAVWSGVDSIHAGMFGGYLSDPEEELKELLNLLIAGNVTPALSCGMNKDLIKPIVEKFGLSWMANVGGAVHSHPDGSKAGAAEIRQVIDEINPITPPDYEPILE